MSQRVLGPSGRVWPRNNTRVAGWTLRTQTRWTSEVDIGQTRQLHSPHTLPLTLHADAGYMHLPA